MKEVIVLRHGKKIGDSLSPEGVAECKALAQRIGLIDMAISSPRHRASQTAELLAGKRARSDIRAFVPDFPEQALAKLEASQQTDHLGIIGAIWQNPALVEDARKAGMKLVDLVDETMARLRRNQRALIISHDGTMIALEKLLKNEPFDTVDHTFEPLQGIVIDERFNVTTFKGKDAEIHAYIPCYTGSMSDHTLSELTELVRKSFAKYDKQGTEHWTWETAAKDLSYQVGSLTKVILQLSGNRWADGKSADELEWQFRNELADILAEVLYIAAERGIDMNKAIEEMCKDDHKKVSERTNGTAQQ